MKLDSNCFLINCDLAKTMKKICKVVGINEHGFYKYLIAPIDDPTFVISARDNCVRSPKRGEVEAGYRLFD